MGKGSFLGGGTVVGPIKNPDWFGRGGVTVPRSERKAELREEMRRRRKAEPEGRWSDVERKLQEALAERTDEEIVEIIVDRPAPASVKPLVDGTVEEQIASLSKNLKAISNRIRSDLSLHEQHRQELIRILAKYHLPETAYPELKELRLKS